MIKRINRKEERTKRHLRKIKSLKGTENKPRICFNRSLKNIYIQLIDDEQGKTLLGLGSMSKELKDKLPKKGIHIENAKFLGTEFAKKCIDKNVKKVVFDRNGFKYHGRVKAFADAARETGLEF